MNLHNTSTLIEKLRKDLNWYKIFSFIQSTKDEKEKSSHQRFNDCDTRHAFLEHYSKGIKVLNENGRDLIFYNECHLEVKFKKYLAHNKNGKKRELIDEIIISNSNGKKQKDEISDSYAPYCLLIDLHSASIIKTEDLNPFLDRSKPGQLVARKVPCELAKEIININSLNLTIVDNFILSKFYEDTNMAIIKEFEKRLTEKNNNDKMSAQGTQIMKKTLIEIIWEVILEHNNDFTIETLQKLLKERGVGLEKSENSFRKCCWECLEKLIEQNKLSKSKITPLSPSNKFTQNIYKINKNIVNVKNYNSREVCEDFFPINKYVKTVLENSALSEDVKDLLINRKLKLI